MRDVDLMIGLLSPGVVVSCAAVGHSGVCVSVCVLVMCGLTNNLQLPRLYPHGGRVSGDHERLCG